MVKIDINLREFFEKEARSSLVPAQKRLLSNRRGVRNDDAPHNDPSYAITKPRGDFWLFNTGDLYRNVFQYKSDKMKLTLFANQNKHSGVRKVHSGFKVHTYKAKNPPTYEDLIGWHTTRYSGFYQALPIGSQFPRRMGTEIFRQIRPQMAKVFNRNWKIIL